MHIDIYSDPICPWCYIGKRRLERALQARTGLRSSVRWRAFQLNPAMAEHGMERQAYLAAKFGSVVEAQRLYGHIGQVGATEGIAFRFDRIAVTPNTVDAHRLIRFAQRTGCEDSVLELLFRTYFTDGGDIGDHTVLAQIAEEAGLDATAAARFLAGTEETEAVRSEDMQGRRLGIEGVPCFIVNQRYALSGAQEPEAFFGLFDMVVEEPDQDAEAR